MKRQRTKQRIIKALKPLYNYLYGGTQMKHTPGPWKIFTNTRTKLPAIVGPGGNTVADISEWTDTGTSDPDMIKANAQLIAIAPELLGELQRLVAYLDDDQADNSTITANPRATIRKATSTQDDPPDGYIDCPECGEPTWSIEFGICETCNFTD